MIINNIIIFKTKYSKLLGLKILNCRDMINLVFKKQEKINIFQKKS